MEKENFIIDTSENQEGLNSSPPWGWGTKLIVGILLVVGFLALIIRFNE